MLDATHPFAHRISARTANVCDESSIPYCQLLRPEWVAQKGDKWTHITCEEDAARHIETGATVFLATGRQTLDRFASLAHARLICRQIDPPDRPFPFPNGQFLVGRPPFPVEDEVNLFERLGVDWLVVKNAGGEASRTKLTVARQLGIRVAMIARPATARRPEGCDRAGRTGVGCAAMTGRIIETCDDVEEGADYLETICPRLAHARSLIGPLPLRRKPDGFAELLSAIVSQQVSTASANAIWGRMKAAKLTGPRKIMWASDDDLRAVGLSRQKIRYARALAEARIDFNGLRGEPNAEIMRVLTEVPGIGQWTAEIYAMFSLGRADVFAPGDLALQEAARILYDLPERPRERELRQMAEAWAPWRSVAARLLWAYYRVAKQREGIR